MYQMPGGLPGGCRDFNLRRQKNPGGCTSSRDCGSQGGSGAFCLKICDVLAQQDEFSIDIAITFGRL